MRHYILLILTIFGLCLTSCRDDFEFEPSSGGLEFSRDTVYLDTVFTNIGSSTYTLKVYNRSDKDIAIPSIRLGKGDSSKYRLMVDGDGIGQGSQPGKIFNNVELLAKDSMFIFIETTVDVAEANPTDFLYTDKIEFHSTNGVQDVDLVTLIQDAYFLFPRRNEQGQYEAVRFDSDSNPGDPELIYGFNLDHADPDNGDEYHWNNTKPYVIYGYATVPAGETLTVDPGARIHFHANSGLMVRPGATLHINGQPSPNNEPLQNEVIFEGDRLEPGFAEVAGQWGAVLLMSGAENTINHLSLKNASVGLYVKAPEGDNTTIPKLTVNNTQIYNSGNYGILSMRGNITATNMAVNRAGQASVALLQGGAYNFTHCTIANYTNAFNQVPLIVSDYVELADEIRLSDLNADFTNCIFWGSGNLGIRIEKLPNNNSGTAFNYRFRNSLIKFADFSNQYTNNPLYQFADNVHYVNVVRANNSNQNKPEFADPDNNNLKIGENSAARNIGFNAGVPVDITGIARDISPDAGAYEYVPE
jgi:hypothetical protein